MIKGEKWRWDWSHVGLFCNRDQVVLFKETKGSVGDKGVITRLVSKAKGSLDSSPSTQTHTHSKPLSPSLPPSLSPSHIRMDIQMEGGEGTSTKEEKRRKIKRICVFCGSRDGYKSSFSDAAQQLGKELVKRNIDLVYGGGSVGLMGLISQTVFDGGCHVLGVIPKALLSHEISGETIGELKVVAGMHQRKSEMAKHADAFIALPGGYGTMEELLEMITWSQLGIHDKPVGLLNVDGYYNSLLALFDKGVETGFIQGLERQIMVSADTAHDLINKMEEYEAAHGSVVPRQSWEMDQSFHESTTTTTSGVGNSNN